jgi:hypothetical protein
MWLVEPLTAPLPGWLNGSARTRSKLVRICADANVVKGGEGRVEQGRYDVLSVVTLK